MGADDRSGPLFPISQGRCYGKQFRGKITYPLHLSLCYSETESDIAFRIRAFIAPRIALHHVRMVKIGSLVFELKWVESENCAETRPKLFYIAEYLNNY